jgi:hypothetical protein
MRQIVGEELSEKDNASAVHDMTQASQQPLVTSTVSLSDQLLVSFGPWRCHSEMWFSCKWTLDAS